MGVGHHLSLGCFFASLLRGCFLGILPAACAPPKPQVNMFSLVLVRQNKQDRRG